MTFHFVLLLSADAGCAWLIFHSVYGTPSSRGNKVPCSRGSVRARRDQQRRMLVAPCQVTGTGSLLQAVSDPAALNLEKVCSEQSLGAPATAACSWFDDRAACSAVAGPWTAG